jgi:hypothetical protein
MSTYTPDRWVILEFTSPKLEAPLQKVFAGWYGGYLNGDNWQLNSGNVSCHKNNEWYEFVGHSGSVYNCHQESYGMSGYMSSVYASMQQKAYASKDTTITIISLDNIVVS